MAALIMKVAGRLLARPIVGWLLRGSGELLAAWCLVPADLGVEKPWAYVAFAGLVLGNWVVLEFAAGRPPGGTVPGSLALVALGAAVVLIHAHSARFTDAATLLAAGLGGCALIAWWFRIDTGGVMAAVAVFLPGILLAGYTETYSEVPWTSFALVAAAPLLLTPTLVGPLSRMPVRYLQLLRFGLLLMITAVAVLLAYARGIVRVLRGSYSCRGVDGGEYRRQCRKVGGFDEMVIEARFHRVTNVFRLSVARQGHQQRRFGGRLAAQVAGHFITIHAGQANIQQDRLRLKRGERLSARPGRRD